MSAEGVKLNRDEIDTVLTMINYIMREFGGKVSAELRNMRVKLMEAQEYTEPQDDVPITERLLKEDLKKSIRRLRHLGELV